MLASSPELGTQSLSSIADTPDRGTLVNYDRRTAQSKSGAYTSHRVQVSEDHAIRAIVTGKLNIPTPSGDQLQLKYERHAENTNGNWTWVGRLAGDVAQEAIITFGEKAVFGSIPQGNGRPDLQLTTRAGKLWVVETDPRLAPSTDRRERDTIVPVAAGRARLAASSSPSTSKATSTSTSEKSSHNTIDVALGYTGGFATKFGGQSQAVTRLTHLVEINNQAYVNSQINGSVRLVGTQQVNYTDSSTNKSALVDLTGHSGSARTTVPASLLPLRAARDEFGADLVALVRVYEFSHEGCGIAWLLGANQQSIVPSEDESFGYSIISNLPDGQSAPGTDGKNYFCSKETLAHELAHLMGSAHDAENAKSDTGVQEYGRFVYSFGMKTDPTTGNFYTIMSYGDDNQTPFRVFSNPNVSICGGLACGVVNQVDNARSLNQTIPVVAGFRASAVAEVGAPGDFNGDGRSDVLWREGASGRNQIWLSANAATQQAMTGVPVASWEIVGTGDFNADGRADAVWRDSATGRNQIWLSGNSGTLLAVTTVPVRSWEIVGTGDFNGDGRSDLLWRDSATGRNQIWLSGSSGTPQAVASITTLSWKVAGVGDFNADGRSDILWRDSASGMNEIWLAGNASTRQAVTSVAAQSWKVVGIGDFNSDGRSDIVWRDSDSGRNSIWLSGQSSTQQSMATVTSSAWRIVQVGDFNADGRSDLVWRNSANGSNVVWLGGSATTTQGMATVPSQSWEIVPSRP